MNHHINALKNQLGRFNHSVIERITVYYNPVCYNVPMSRRCIAHHKFLTDTARRAATI